MFNGLKVIYEKAHMKWIMAKTHIDLHFAASVYMVNHHKLVDQQKKLLHSKEPHGVTGNITIFICPKLLNLFIYD